MDSGHILQKFPEIRCPLDHYSKPPPEAMEQWKSDVHIEVGQLCSQFANTCGSHFIVELSAPCLCSFSVCICILSCSSLIDGHNLSKHGLTVIIFSTFVGVITERT